MGRPLGRKNGNPRSDAQRKRRQRAKERAALKALLAQGETLLKAEKEAERQARRIEVTSQLGIRPLAIAQISEVDLASNSGNAVITDPPYAEVDVPLYGELARFAMRVLKPSGWCLAMIGDLYLNLIVNMMLEPGLVYRDFIAISFPGGHHTRIGPSKTFQACKLILVWQKPPIMPPPAWGPNVIVAAKNGHDKSLHPWQQNQEVFGKLIERFTLPGDLIVDPFAGSGTTLRAALRTGRLAWGADIFSTRQGSQDMAGI